MKTLLRLVTLAALLVCPVVGQQVYQNMQAPSGTYVDNSVPRRDGTANRFQTSDIWFPDVAAAVAGISSSTGNDLRLLGTNGIVYFSTGGTDRWVVNASGAFNPIVDNTYDIGNGSVNPRDVTLSRTLTAKGTLAHIFGTTNTVTIAAGRIDSTRTADANYINVGTTAQESGMTLSRAGAIKWYVANQTDDDFYIYSTGGAATTLSFSPTTGASVFPSTSGHIFGTTNTVTLAAGVVTATGAGTFGDDVNITRNYHGITSLILTNTNTDTSDYGTQAGINILVGGNAIGSLKSTAKDLVGITGPSLFLTTIGNYPIAFGLNNSATPSMVLASTGLTVLPGIVGTTTNDAAAAGNVGALLSAQLAAASTTSLVTATAKTITSISLTAGDWEVTGTVHFIPANTTVVASLIAGVSTADNTQASVDSVGGWASIGAVYTSGGATMSATPIPTRISLAATTTYYLVATGTFEISTCTAYGTIRSRRLRRAGGKRKHRQRYQAALSA